MPDLPSEQGHPDGRCNCPSERDVFREGVGTKPPCPVHDTPERLAALSEMVVPVRGHSGEGPDG